MPLLTGIFHDAIESQRRARARNVQRRSSLENPQTPLSFPAEWLLDIYNGGRTDSGIRVSEMTALQVSDIYAAVDLISSAIAALPIQTFERTEITGAVQRHSRRLATENDIFDLLRYEPNPEMTSFVFIKTLQVHMLLWGNGYAEIERDPAGRVRALWPRNPSKTRPYRSNTTSELFYKTSEGVEFMNTDYEDNRPVPERSIAALNMVHCQGLSLDGRIGQDVIQLARQLVGLSLGSEKYAAKFFGNGAIPGGILTHPAKLRAEAAEQLRRSWSESQGGENVHRVAVLEEGMTYTKIGATPSEAQMIEARKQCRAEIAALFHVPITMLGETGVAKANAEQVGLEFVNYTLAPWVVVWEQELKRKLLRAAAAGRNAGRVFFVRMDTRRLTMPDAASKKEFYSSGRQGGFLSANDVREYEDMVPINDPSAELHWIPVNMTIVDGPEGLPKIPGGGETGKQKGDPPDGNENERHRRAGREHGSALWNWFRDCFGRAAARKELDQKTSDRIFQGVLAEGDARSGALEAAFVAACGAKPETIEFSARQAFNSIFRLMPGPQLFIARHGEADDDLPGDGMPAPEIVNPPLNEFGRAQAQWLADYVSRLPRFYGVYAPELRKYQETMNAVAAAGAMAMHTDPALDPHRLSRPPLQSEREAMIRTLEHYRRQSELNGPCLLITGNRAMTVYAEYLRKTSADAMPELKSKWPYAGLAAISAEGNDLDLIFNPESMKAVQ